MAEKLKPGGKRVRFGDVVRLNKETCKDPAAQGIERYVGLEHLEPGDLRIRSWGSVADGTTFTNRFRPGQVLFGKRRAYQRKVAVADFDGICSGDIYVFESADPERLLPELLPFLCQTDAFFEHALGTSAGSLSPRTNWKSLANYEVAVPPLEEQRRIGAMLSSFRSLLEQLADGHVASDRLIESLCRHVHAHAFSLDEYVAVGSISRFTSGKSMIVSKLPKEASPEAHVPVYGGNGIAGYTNKAIPGAERPTLVIGRVGQFCGITRMTDGPAWISDNALYPVRIDAGIDQRFLGICLRGANLNRGKLGEYLPLITQRVVHETEVPWPTTDEQLRWIEAYETTCRAAESALARLTKARHSYGSFLNRSLSGS